ncbi:MAG: tetratricopeptide repeat protein [Litorimonas sp.]
MKTLILSATVMLATATAAHANEVFADPLIADGLASVPAGLQQTLEDCLSEDSSSRAIRACTKTLRAAPPNDDLRANLYTRRALHKMALGRFDEAATDFDRAGAVSGAEDMAALGQGFAAMMDRDLASAKSVFEAKPGTPLAAYGLGLTHQMAGNDAEARKAYERALELRPGWVAVTDRMDALDAQ